MSTKVFFKFLKNMKVPGAVTLHKLIVAQQFTKCLMSYDFENTVLRRIFGSKTEEVTEEWRRLRKEDLYALNSSPDIILLIKSRMRWAGHVTSRGKGEVYHTGFWWENLREGNHLEDPGVDGKVILKWTFEKWIGRSCTGSIWLRIRTGGGLLWMQW